MLTDYGQLSFPTFQIDNDAINLSFHLLEPAIASDIEIPESKARRKLELRLQHNFIANMCPTFSACHNVAVREAWSTDVPKVALEHDNLLYEMFAISAFHLLKSDPNDAELIAARQTYLSLSLHEQRKAVSRLDSRNADAVCLASSLILMDSFASLQDRALDPYLPPMEWLYMARGAGSLYGVALDRINNFKTSRIMAIAMAEPLLDDANVVFAESNRTGLLGLLSQEIIGEFWDKETKETYEKTLSYLGGVQIGIDRGEHPLATLRRMMAFALLAPKKFIQYVGEQRPRALVILAHFFALASNVKDIWWIGDIAQREVQGIWDVLPLEWHVMMRKPLATSRLA